MKKLVYGAALLLSMSAVSAELLVSTDSVLYTYSIDGELSSSDAIPAVDGVARDIVDMAADGVAVYNGTFNPVISVLNSNIWQDYQVNGLSTVNNGSYGGIAALDGKVFATDMRTGGSTADSAQRGIVRLDLTSAESERFFDGTDYIDLNVGLDGLLYALRNTYGALDVIDPATMELVRSLALGHTSASRAIAADFDGTLFMASWNGVVVKFDANGAELDRLAVGNDLTDIDINQDGLLAIGSRFGEVFVSDVDLATLTSFSAGSNGTFVGFTNEPSLPTYCDNRGTNTSYEWIESVAIGTTQETTGNNNGYVLLEETALTLAKGTTNTIVLSPGFSSGAYSEGWLVSLDLDRDGEFETTAQAVSRGQTSVAVNVPDTVTSGQVRMRVSMQWRSAPSNCGSFTWGEAEDYTVTVN